MQIDWEVISTILWLIFTLLSAHLGRKYANSKNLLKEVGELLIVLNNAVADDKIDKEEIQRIMKEYKDVEKLIKEILHK